MKKAIRRLTAAAMAFALIGTYSALTGSISAVKDNTLTASASSPYRYVSYWRTATIEDVYVYNQLGVQVGHYTVYHYPN